MRRLLVGCLAMMSVGCGTPSASLQPLSAAWTPPPGWVTVSNVEGSVQLTMPPYIRVGDNHGAIFANEAPPPGTSEIPIQVWAEGPVIDGAPKVGDDLRAWVDGRIDSRGKGVPAG